MTDTEARLWCWAVVAVCSINLGFAFARGRVWNLRFHTFARETQPGWFWAFVAVSVLAAAVGMYRGIVGFPGL